MSYVWRTLVRTEARLKGKASNCPIHSECAKHNFIQHKKILFEHSRSQKRADT